MGKANGTQHVLSQKSEEKREEKAAKYKELVVVLVGNVRGNIPLMQNRVGDGRERGGINFLI